MTQMTDEQIENWRKMLSRQIGVMAYLVPASQIQALRDKLQADLDKATNIYCDCDTKKHGYTRHMDDTVTCNNCQKLRAVSNEA